MYRQLDERLYQATKYLEWYENTKLMTKSFLPLSLVFFV